MADRIKTDILIFGGGVAGCFAAIKAKEAGATRITLVSKGKLGADGASTFGAGVYFAPTEDEREAMFLKHALAEEYGAGLYDESWLHVALEESYERLLEMDRWGVQVAKTSDGKFKRTAGRRGRVFVLPGPQTMEALARKVIDSGIEVIGNTMITDLLTDEGKPGKPVVGAVGFDVRTGEFRIFEATATVLASGGCGFKSKWSGHRNLTGDGTVAAYKAGAELGGFEMGNLIVTGSEYDVMGQNPLVGLGARWVNAKGERYMLEYDPEAGDKAVTARLAEATAMEIKGGNGPIYLDMTHFTSEEIKNFAVMYPLTVKLLERAGIIVGDKVVGKLEVEPIFVGTFNSTGGGVKANTSCETSLPGLYACGDAMIRRLHAPFAIPGAAVSGARAGKSAAIYAREIEGAKINEVQVGESRKSAFAPLEREDGLDPDHVILGLLEALVPYGVSIIARGDRIEKAIKEVQRIRDEELPLLHASDPHYLRLANEARNMVFVAEMYLRSRLLREESRESCLREDYPYVDNINWLKWTWLKQEAGKMRLWTENLAIDKCRLKPERKEYLHPVFEVARKRGIQWG